MTDPVIKGKKPINKMALEAFQTGGVDEKNYSAIAANKMDNSVDKPKSVDAVHVLPMSFTEDKRMTKTLRLRESCVNWMQIHSMQTSLELGRKVTEAELYEAAINLYRAQIERNKEIKK